MAESSRKNISDRNGQAALKELLGCLKIKVTDTAVYKTNYSKNYDVLSLTNALYDWNIGHLVVKISSAQLSEIPYPAIAHLNKNNGHFVVLKKFNADQLHYYDPEIGLIKESIHDFEKKWTGVVLLVEANEKSGEEGYNGKRRQEIFYQLSSYLTYTLSSFILILPVFFISLSILPYYLLKIFGAAFCFLLLQKQLGASSKALATFCGLGSKSNCDAVIHSHGSKLFGVISLSEIGLLYFIGAIITMMVSAFAGIAVSSLLATLTFLILPFTILSVYYQWRVVNAWCPLCLVVMLVVWLEAISLVPLLSSVSFEIKSIVITGIGFSIPLTFWLSIRERFIDSYRIPDLEHVLYRFKRSGRIFQSLLSNQPNVDMGLFSNEIRIGNEDAPVTVTLVSNPTCGPCSTAHAIMEDLLERFEDKLKVNFRFTVNPNEPESSSMKMVRHLVALSLTDSEKCMRALSAWYIHGGRKDINQWVDKFPAHSLNGNGSRVKEILSEHSGWCLKAGITATPTLFINGKNYPEEYALSDMKFQIRKLLEAILDREPEQVS